MKGILKHAGLRLSPAIDKFHYYFDFFHWKKIDQITAINKQNQILLTLKYRDVLTQGARLPRFDEVEFRSFSQHGEDGILLYIFALVGTTNKQAVEICAGDGIECNSANLIINHDWDGLLFDGSASNIKMGNAFYKRHLNTLQHPPTLVNCWIDAEGVAAVIAQHGVQGEIDLLSLDMDGVDYWVCKSISSLHPRVIVLEYNACLGPETAVTVEYRSDFRRQGLYWGASLSAFTNLLHARGYQLVGSDRSGINAFFIRSDINKGILPAVTPAECFISSRAQEAYKHNAGQAEHYPWVQV